MANKYSRYSLKPYQSQYVDTKRVDIAKLLRERYDKNKSEYDLLQRTAGSMSLLEGDSHHKDNFIQDLNSKFESTIAANNFEGAGNVISGAITDFHTNEALNTSKKSYANWAAEQEMNMELRAKGHRILFDKVYQRNESGEIMYDENNNPIMMDAAQAHSSYYQGENGEMISNVYTPSSEAMLDWDRQMQELMQGIAKDSTGLQRMGITPGQLAGYLRYGTGISEGKVRDVANAAITTYLASQEGMQHLKYLTEQDINPETGQNYSHDQAINLMTNQLFSVGKKQVGFQFNYMQDKEYWMGLEQQQNQTLLQEWNTTKRKVSMNGKGYNAFDVMGNKEVDGKTVLWDRYFDQNGNYNFDSIALDITSMNAEDLPGALKEIADEINHEIEKYGTFADIPDKTLDNNIDAYVAHMLINNRDARFAIDPTTNEPYFKNDKEFLEALGTSSAAWDMEAGNMIVPTPAYLQFEGRNIAEGQYINNEWAIWNPDEYEYTNNLSDFLDVAAKQYKNKHDLNVNSKKDARSIIETAISDPNVLKVNGFLPNGRNAGSHSVVLQIPANYIDGIENRAATIEVEVAGHNEAQKAFQNSWQIMDDLRNHNYDSSHNLPITPIDTSGDGNLDAVIYTTISYEMDPSSQQMVPVATRRFYSYDSFQAGQLIDNPREVAQPQVMKGREIVNQIMDAEMSAYVKSNNYSQFINASKLTSGGTALE